MASHKKHGIHDHGEHVILPRRTYYGVFGVLLVLTVLTVSVASIDLGAINVAVALGIAIVKAALVVMYFMMLKFDNRVNVMVFATGIAFLLVFLGFTMLDTELRGRFERIERITVMEQRQLEAEAATVDPGVGDVLFGVDPAEAEVPPPAVEEEEEEDNENDNDAGVEDPPGDQ